MICALPAAIFAERIDVHIRLVMVVSSSAKKTVMLPGYLDMRYLLFAVLYLIALAGCL